MCEGLLDNTKYSLQKAFAVCVLIASTTDSLDKLHKEHPSIMPDEMTVRKWAMCSAEFKEMYEFAFKQRLLNYMNESLNEFDDIATYIDRNGNYRLDAVDLSRRSIKVENARYLAERLLPKQFAGLSKVDGVESELFDRIASASKAIVKQNLADVKVSLDD